MEKTALKEIVVTLDFSEESLNALRFAIVFIKKFRANIRLVYVINKHNKFIEKDGIGERVWAIQQMEKIIEKFKVRLKKDELSYHLLEGQIHTEVLKFAESKNAFIVFTSTHGISGFREFLIGNVANRIVNHACIPVLTVKDHSCSRSISRIVLPIDRTLNTRQKVPIAAEISKKHKAEIHLVMLDSSESQESKNILNNYFLQVRNYLDEAGVNFKKVNLSGSDFPKMILDYSKEIEANLIILMSDMESIAKSFLLGATAQNIVNVSPFPVLCIHPKELYITTGIHSMS